MDKKAIAKFFAYVEKTDTCWNWTGPKRGHKPRCYGTFMHNKIQYTAHRFSYELHSNEVLGKFYACHHCDNTLCVNPSHLFKGTHQDNMNDAKLKNRHHLKGKRGEQNKSAKLCEKIVLAIRNETGTARALAVKYKVHHKTIQNIKNRSNWTHI